MAEGMSPPIGFRAGVILSAKLSKIVLSGMTELEVNRSGPPGLRNCLRRLILSVGCGIDRGDRKAATRGDRRRSHQGSSPTSAKFGLPAGDPCE
jgi:hypothetical protein